MRDLDWPDKPTPWQDRLPASKPVTLCVACETNPADMADTLCAPCRDAARAEDEWWERRQERLREWADEDQVPLEHADVWEDEDEA